MAHQPPGQFQFQQRQLHRGRALSALPDQFIDRDRGHGQQAGDVSGFIGQIVGHRLKRAAALTKAGRGRDRRSRRAARSHPRPTAPAPRLRGSAGCSLAARLERRAGDRHHLAPCLPRQPRGDQRAGLGCSLDHQCARSQPGDDPVA